MGFFTLFYPQYSWFDTGHFTEASSQKNVVDRNIATVYRNLNLFKRQGLIEKKHLGQTRCFYDIKGPIQHQHLICRECGKVIDFNCPLNEIIEKVKYEHNFMVAKAEVYIEGYCAECAEDKDKIPPD